MLSFEKPSKIVFSLTRLIIKLKSEFTGNYSSLAYSHKHAQLHCQTVDSQPIRGYNVREMRSRSPTNREQAGSDREYKAVYQFIHTLELNHRPGQVQDDQQWC